MFPGKFFAALLSVAAVGVTGSPVRLEKRNNGPYVYYCDGANGTKPCTHVQVTLDECTYIPKEENIDSFQPDPDIYCNLTGWDCTGGYHPTYPPNGVSDLAEIGWGNMVHSFRCEKLP